MRVFQDSVLDEIWEQTRLQQVFFKARCFPESGESRGLIIIAAGRGFAYQHFLVYSILFVMQWLTNFRPEYQGMNFTYYIK